MDQETAENVEIGNDTDAEYVPDEDPMLTYGARSSKRNVKVAIWLFFKRIEPHESRLAKCNTCQEVKSFKTTTSNLRAHLKKHPKAMEKYLKYQNKEIPFPKLENVEVEEEDATYVCIEPYKPRFKDQAIWKYFQRLPDADRIAKCKFCQQIRSFRTSITNLRTHLYLKHPQIVEEDQAVMPRHIATDETSSEKSTPSNRRVKKDQNLIFSKFFTVDTSRNIANCKFCLEDIHFTTDATLKYHALKIHGDIVALTGSDAVKDKCDEENDDDSESTDKRKLSRRSENWNYFQLVDEERKIARCNTCSRELSYTTISNLKKHLTRKHRNEPWVGANNVTSEFVASPVNQNGKRNVTYNMKVQHRFRSRVWKYFDIMDEIEKIATCKMCSKDLCYKGISNLRKHLRRKHGGCPSSDEEGEAEVIEEQSAPVWAYFKCLSQELKIASCLICNKRVEYTDTRDLTKHVTRKHPHAQAKLETEGNKPKKLMITGNGDIYEIDDDVAKQEVVSTHEADEESEGWEYNNDEIDTLETEEYLDESMFDETHKTPKKRRLTYQKPVQNENPIDLFGKYIVSLLKKLPKNKSDKLQADFVRQIMDAQNESENTSNRKTRSEPNVENTRSKPSIGINRQSIGGHVTSNCDVRVVNFDSGLQEIVVGKDRAVVASDEE